MADRTVTITHEELRALLAERVRVARGARRESDVQALMDRLCEECLTADEIHLGVALSLLSNLRVMQAQGLALAALYELHDELAPRALLGADPN